MKITLRDVHDSNQHLQSLSNQFMDLDLSIIVSQALAVFEQQTKFLNKAITDKAGKLGFRLGQNPGDPPTWIEPEGKPANVTFEIIEGYNLEVEEFLATNFVQVPVSKITRKQLADNKIKTSPNMILKLHWLLDLTSKQAKEEAAEGDAKPRRALELAKRKHA